MTTVVNFPGNFKPRIVPAPKIERDIERDIAVSHEQLWLQIRQSVFTLTHANGKQQMREKLLDLVAELDMGFTS